MQISNEIIKVFEYMGEKLGIALDWTSESILPYIQDLCDRYIIYCIVINILWFIIGLIITYCGSKFFTYTKIHKEFGCVFSYKEDNEIARGLLYIVSVFILFVGINITFMQVFDLVECATIPEKIIYDFITSEMNNL